MAANKRVGKKSLSQNDHLIPYAPTLTSAADVGINRAYNDGAIAVNFSSNGPYSADSFTVTATGPNGTKTATGSSSPILVVGLESNTTYTVHVVANNAYGSSEQSNNTNVLVTTVPKVISSITASSPNAGYDDISWTEPLNGGKTITGYHWESDDGKAGDTTSTSVANIAQEQGTAQSYRVYATNQNGNSEWSGYSNQVTTTFSFVPFGAFGFSPFGAFGFSPFGAFGFSPFGFSPFGAFGFSPFGAFGFSPFGFSPFGFSPYAPRCIAGDTEIATVGPDNSVLWVKAKDIRVGDKVFSPVWDEFDGTPSPYESRIEYDALTNKRIGIGEIEYVLEKNVEESIIFNEDQGKHFSKTQPVLARKVDGKDAWEFTSNLSAGDILWEYDFDKKEYVETLITDVNLIRTPNDVFQIGVKDIDTFVAGGVISHNK